MNRALLMNFDTSYLFYRSFFGVPSSMRAPDGRPVNAIRGTLETMARAIDEFHPTHVAACWDADWRPAWRVELVPSYKTHRLATAQPGGSGPVEDTPDELAPQVPLIAEALRLLGLPPLGVAGYEADDVIGTLAATSGMPSITVTGDRDLFQVVDDDRGAQVLYFAKGWANKVLADEEWVRSTYGVRPSQYADFATLRGDASDGLPGVSGIGEKSAASLLSTYGSLEGVLAAANSGQLSASMHSRLSAGIDYIAAARPVVSVVTDLALPEVDLTLPLEPADAEALQAFAAELGVESSVQRLLAAMRGGARDA